MSALILPARSLLKPDRAWDIPRPAGHRHRPRWWRHLLGGRSGLTRLQPGACCGCVATCPCDSPTCSIPQSDLTLTLAGIGCYNGTYTLTYGSPVCGGLPTNCGWEAAYFCPAAGSNRYWTFGCLGSRWTLQLALVDPCSGPSASCSINTTTANTYTCSPLYIQWVAVSCPGLSNPTITVSA